MLWEAIQQSEEEYAPEIANKLSIWINRVRHQLRRIRIDIQVLAPWLLALANMPQPAQLETQTRTGGCLESTAGKPLPASPAG